MDNLEQSPNWDNISKLIETNFKPGIDRIEGFPFDEGFPVKDPAAKRYELILVSGERLIARVDYTKLFASEGLEWKRLGQGQKSYERHVVAAWKEYQKKEDT